MNLKPFKAPIMDIIPSPDQLLESSFEDEPNSYPLFGIILAGISDDCKNLTQILSTILYDEKLSY